MSIWDWTLALVDGFDNMKENIELRKLKDKV